MLLVWYTKTYSKLILFAKGSNVQVDIPMYCFQELDPDSRPNIVYFLSLNTRPISVPKLPMLTLTVSQSGPNGLSQF